MSDDPTITIDSVTDSAPAASPPPLTVGAPSADPDALWTAVKAKLAGRAMAMSVSEAASAQLDAAKAEASASIVELEAFLASQKLPIRPIEISTMHSTTTTETRAAFVPTDDNGSPKRASFNRHTRRAKFRVAVPRAGRLSMRDARRYSGGIPPAPGMVGRVMAARAAASKGEPPSGASSVTA